MASNRKHREVGGGCDATHRARIFHSHHSHQCMAGYHHLLGERCARHVGHRLPNPAFQPKSERAIGALREVPQ